MMLMSCLYVCNVGILWTNGRHLNRCDITGPQAYRIHVNLITWQPIHYKRSRSNGQRSKPQCDVTYQQ